MQILRTDGLKQIFLLSLILIIGLTLVWQLYYFIPGFLGAITLYIITRQFFFKLTLTYGWKRWVSSLTIILASIVLFLIPIWIIIQMLIPRFAYALSHTSQLIEQGEYLLQVVKEYIPYIKITEEHVQQIITKAATIVPTLLNATFSLVINILTALFILYFMFMSGTKMEKKAASMLPMNNKNIDSLWEETRNLVISNAIGIPLLMIAQGIVAIIGYLIFGVEQAIIWGVLTGVASILPVVGTMIVWIPICIVLISSGDVAMGIGLTLYCGIIVSNIDNVLRFTMMKKIGDVHPLITVFGVIVGLNIFGLMGLIFGPLLITYFLLLIKIYRLEFSSKNTRILNDL